MALLARGGEIGFGTNVLNTHSGGMATQFVYGAMGAIMVATREDGYHSRPHRHRSEQINYVTEGEIWVFIEFEGFLAQKGDFYRVPSDAVHWGWNLGGGPVSTVQAFAPPVDPFTRKNAVALFGDDEEVVLEDHTNTVYIEDESEYLEFERTFFEQLDNAGEA